MARRPGPVRAAAEYAFVRSLAACLGALPLGAAGALGRGIAAAFHAADRRHRDRCVDAIRQGLDVDEADARRTARAMYRHLGLMLADFPRLQRMTPETAEAWVEWGDAPDVARRLLDEGRGLVYVTGHISNWEACGSAWAAKGLVRGAIARPLDNPHLDRWVRGVREASGQAIWDKFGALREALRTLRDGGALGVLMDQDGGKDGVFATTFFGRPCSTWPTVADLAIRTGAPIFVACIHRTAPMRFRVAYARPFRADPDAPAAAERVRLLQRCNDDLEMLIRQQPEQWLWLHRRWKTQPPARPGA